MPAISIDGLRVVRGERVVLDGLRVEVPAGTVTGLLGPSGCGKTTLMRAIVGVQRLAGGRVDVLGVPAGTARLRSRVAYLPQAPSVYTDLSVDENLRYFARVAGAGRARIAEVLATVGLDARRGQIVGSLSGGECARVSLAVALLARPELLVLDEPTVGLDPLLRAELWTAFRALAAGGATLLVSSHVMDEAAECDALLLMRDGAILQHTTPTELRLHTGERDLGQAFLTVIRGRGMSARVTFATAQRVLWQIRRDPRTIALLLVVPAGLLILLRYVLDGRPLIFQGIGAPLCGLFPFIAMFLVTSIAMLRERTSGTLERLMTLPLAKLDLLAGYALAFGALAVLQALVVCTVGFATLGLDAPHGVWLVGVLAVGNAVLGMALGLFVSAFARTEFQAVQFMPALVLPQLLLCGLFAARDEMAPLLYAVSWALPFTYAYDALARVTRDEALGGGRVALDAAVLLAAITTALVLGAATLRRQTS